VCILNKVIIDEANVSKLKWLALHNTAVGDAGLEHLKGIETLEYVDLYPRSMAAGDASCLLIPVC
jgi:hypothetical protein